MKSLDAINSRLDKLRIDTGNLVIRSQQDGVWFAPEIDDYVGRWIPRGSSLGLTLNPHSFEFAATVLQEDADTLFGHELRGAEVRLPGEAAIKLPVRHWRIVPGEQQTLPSAALGWKGGGDVPVSMDDSHGNHAAEPFFIVICELEPPAGFILLDGRSGKVRFDLPSEPLLPRWWRRLRQLLQKRYQL